MDRPANNGVSTRGGEWCVPQWGPLKFRTLRGAAVLAGCPLNDLLESTGFGGNSMALFFQEYVESGKPELNAACACHLERLLGDLHLGPVAGAAASLGRWPWSLSRRPPWFTTISSTSTGLEETSPPCFFSPGRTDHGKTRFRRRSEGPPPGWIAVSPWSRTSLSLSETVKKGESLSESHPHSHAPGVFSQG